MEHTPLTPEITLEQALANKGKEKNIKMAFSLHFPRHHGAGDTCPHRERGGANGERDPAVHRDLDGIKWSTSPHPLVPFPFVPPSPAAAAAVAVDASMSASAAVSSTCAAASSTTSRRSSSSPASRVQATPRRSLPSRLVASRTSPRSPVVPPVYATASPGGAGGTTAAAARKKLLIFDAEEYLAESLAKYTARLSGEAVAERGAFTVALSGGSLIKALRKLTESPYLEAVEWSKWHVFWVDERVVPKDHADSNYKLAMDGLLSKVPIPASQIYAINDTLSAEGAADEYETCLKQLVNDGVVAISEVTGFPKLDLMLLGMGPDGHVASLFPGHPIVNENQKWVSYIKDSPKPPPERITFTFPLVNSSAHIALVVTGAGKAGAVHKAFSDKQSSSDLLPVEMVSQQEGVLTWFTDKPAVSMLSSI
uniref:6-phosphogluconolactonase n=1 Tax=Oryza glumipatula TaxID=40148 RepID=A0A0E0AYI3_9ORYZ